MVERCSGVLQSDPLADATGLVDDGARLALGGVLLRRKPIAFLAELADAGRRGLRLYSFLASLDVELLVAAVPVAEVHAGYVGFEQLGFAPAFGRAVASGEVRAYEYSELVFVSGLRASGAGLPFLRPAAPGAPTSSPSSASRRSPAPIRASACWQRPHSGPISA